METVIIQLTQGKEAIISASDAERVLRAGKWCAERRKDTWYAARNFKNERGAFAPVRLHRFIMQAPKGTDVDHIDGDGLNNTRQNLRVCTHAQNQRNRRVNSNSSLGLKGVYFDKRRKRFRAVIHLNGKRHHVGWYMTKAAAALAYDVAARKMHGDFARLNLSTGG
jgi:hypothetical protein